MWSYPLEWYYQKQKTASVDTEKQLLTITGGNEKQ
jgi:hypothetical protein